MYSQVMSKVYKNIIPKELAPITCGLILIRRREIYKKRGLDCKLAIER